MISANCNNVGYYYFIGLIDKGFFLAELNNFLFGFNRQSQRKQEYRSSFYEEDQERVS